MALDGKDSITDEGTVFDASGESLLPGFFVSHSYNPKLAAQQIAATGLQKSMHCLPILDLL
jgi:predicted amidohydrolase YtcJ